MSIYAIRTVTTPTVMPPKPSPKPIQTPRISMAEDARIAQARQRKAWGQDIAVGNAPIFSTRRTAWTPQTLAALDDDIINILRQHGPQSVPEIEARISATCSRHILRERMTILRKAGQVTRQQIGVKRQEWRLQQEVVNMCLDVDATK